MINVRKINMIHYEIVYNGIKIEMMWDMNCDAWRIIKNGMIHVLRSKTIDKAISEAIRA